MAGPGRKRKPEALRVLEGETHLDRMNPSEPKPSVIAAECPDWLGEEGRKMWFRLSGPLLRLGLLTELDHVALEALCRTYESWREKPDNMSRLIRLQSLLSEFGCTPSSRSRITGAVNPADEDPMEALLAGKG